MTDDNETRSPVVRTLWPGKTRPTPAELRTAAYDVAAGPRPERKLLVCAGPRTSSKRLARLLLAAGLGVPMEYFNVNSIRALTDRWGIGPADYLENIYARRTVNGIFASNIQHHQMSEWHDRRDFDDLFDDAAVLHVVRPDKTAQAASLAACFLTGRWGFEPADGEVDYPRAQLYDAARRAVDLVAAEDRGWATFFQNKRVDPVVLTSAEINRHDFEILESVVSGNLLPYDADAARRMLELDAERYLADTGLKSKLCDIIDGNEYM